MPDAPSLLAPPIVAPATLPLHEVRIGPLDGPPVLFLHGICASTSYWTSRYGGLAEKYRCVAVDLLGHGRSPKPHNFAYTLAQQADAVEPVVERLMAGVTRPVPVIAHSMGNFVALEMRRRHPEWIGPIWGMGMPYFPSKDTAFDALLKLNPWAALPLRQPWWAPPMLQVARLSRGKIGFPWFNRVYGLPRDCWEDGFSVTWNSLSRSLHNLILSVDVDALLEGAGTHDLEWWHGSHDASAPFDFVKALWEKYPAVPTSIIKTGTHNVWIFQNAEFIRLFQERLDRYYAPKPVVPLISGPD